MATKRKLCEFEDEPENDQHNINFNPIIELGMQNIPEIPIKVKTLQVQLPEHSLITHTIQLQQYYRELQTIPAAVEKGRANNMKANLVIYDVPRRPENTKLEHTPTSSGVNCPPKVFNEFTAGKGPVILPFTKESHQQALKQCAATTLAFFGVTTCTDNVAEVMSSALDIFLVKFCSLLRAVEDRKARNIPIGFPDAISRVLHDLNMKDLGNYYQDYVVKYNADLHEKCRNYADELKIEYIDKPRALEEQHFAAALDELDEPHNMEQQNLEGLEFMETDGQQPKPEPE